MNNWTNRRKASLAFHAIVVLIPFAFATGSAGAFWYSLFHDWWIAAPMVAVIDLLALSGLILHITRVESPFQAMRHALPFVSIFPLGLELYQLLAAHNAVWIAVTVALLATALMTGIAWRCYATIEACFIDPVTAARERVQEQVRTMTAALIMAGDMQSSIRLAVQDWSSRTEVRIAPAQPDPIVIHAAPQPIQEVVQIGERRYSLRQLAAQTGIPLTTLRRKLVHDGAEEEE